MRERPVIEVFDATLLELTGEPAQPKPPKTGMINLVRHVWNRFLFGSNIRDDDRRKRRDNIVPVEWGLAATGLAFLLSPKSQEISPKDLLSSAIETYQNANVDGTRILNPVRWQNIQFNLGTLLHSFGEYYRDADLIDKAILVLHEDSESTSDYFLGLQKNLLLARSLRAQFRMKATASSIKEAISIYDRALKDARSIPDSRSDDSLYIQIYRDSATLKSERNRERNDELAKTVRLFQSRSLRTGVGQRYTIQKNLADTLLLLGEKERDISALKQAIAHYEELLISDRAFADKLKRHEFARHMRLDSLDSSIKIQIAYANSLINRFRV